MLLGIDILSNIDKLQNIIQLRCNSRYFEQYLNINKLSSADKLSNVEELSNIDM